MIHFEFIYVKEYSLQLGSLFAYECPLSQNHLSKRLLFSIVLNLLLCQRKVDEVSVDLILGSIFCSIDLLVHSFTHISLS